MLAQQCFDYYDNIVFPVKRRLSFRSRFAFYQQASYNYLLRYPLSAAPSHHFSRIR